MKIEQKLLTRNRYSRPGTLRKRTTKIAIHYVGNAGSSAIANRNYFESLKNGSRFASSHYIVGLKGEVIQCVPDEEIAYTTNSANAYSIGIECCHPKSDGVFNSFTRNALIELCVKLCKKYGLAEKDLIRHYDVTGKACPLAWAADKGPKFEDWLKFKSEVAIALGGKTSDDLLSNSVSTIIKSGIMLDYNSWKREDLIKLKNVPELLDKLGGLNSLIQKGVINDRILWEKNFYKEKHVVDLLIKYASKCC